MLSATCDLDIAFESHLPASNGSAADTPRKPIRSHALIGQNGTGKSNLIKALIMSSAMLISTAKPPSTTRRNTAFVAMPSH